MKSTITSLFLCLVLQASEPSFVAAQANPALREAATLRFMNEYFRHDWHQEPELSALLRYALKEDSVEDPQHTKQGLLLECMWRFKHHPKVAERVARVLLSIAQDEQRSTYHRIQALSGLGNMQVQSSELQRIAAPSYRRRLIAT